MEITEQCIPLNEFEIRDLIDQSFVTFAKRL